MVKVGFRFLKTPGYDTEPELSGDEVPGKDGESPPSASGHSM